MKRYLLIFISMLQFGIAPATAFAADILAARIGVRTEGTRFVIDLSGKTEFNIAQNDSDDRIVIDLPNTTLNKGRQVPKLGNGLIKHTMIIGQGKKAAQVILFLKKPVKVNKAFRIAKTKSKPYRIVIDLTEK